MDSILYCFQCMQPLEEEHQVCPHCGYDNHNLVNNVGQLPFSIVNKRYLIGKCLGHGGFGITYIGRDLSLDRRVAIKEYFPKELVYRNQNQSILQPYDEESKSTFQHGRERSMQEARVIARLSDVPDAVSVYDVFLANETLYIVMGYIEGQTLRQYVDAQGGKVEIGKLMQLIRPVFGTLKRIHEQQIIHRDISPDNIMIRKEDGRAVLLDFGAAHDLNQASESEHSTSLRPGYAPLEQYNSKGVQDARIDEYALCATIYFALTGQKPSNAMERFYGDDDLVSLNKAGIVVPPAFEKAIIKGLSVQAKDRYESIEALENALYGSLIETSVKKPKRMVVFASLALVGVAAIALVFFQPNHTGNNHQTVAPSTEAPVAATPVPMEKEASAQEGYTIQKIPALTGEIKSATTGEEVVGKVKDKNFAYTGEPIYQTKDGWLYLQQWGPEALYLWGITEGSSIGKDGTLQLPDSIDGKPVTHISFKFGNNCGVDATKIQTIVIPNSYTDIDEYAFHNFTGVASIVGGKNLEDFSLYLGISQTSPFYQAHKNDVLMVGDGVLMHSVVMEDGKAFVPEGTKVITSHAYFTTDDAGNEVVPAIQSITLPDTLTYLSDAALEGFCGEEITFPDHLDMWAQPFGSWSAESFKNPTIKRIIWGKGITGAFNVNMLDKFSGELYLVDGAQIDSLKDLFPEEEKYTVSCQSRDMILMDDADIPSGVTVVDRSASTQAPATTAMPTSIPTNLATSMPTQAPKTTGKALLSDQDYGNLSHGITWHTMKLKLKSYELAQGDDLETYRRFSDDKDNQYLKFTFYSPQGNLSASIVDTYIRTIMLCDQKGSLHLSQLTGKVSDPKSKTYYKEFSVIFEMDSAAAKAKYMLFIPGTGDMPIYPYHDGFNIPDRRIAYGDQVLWLSDFNDGESLSDSDRESIDAGMKPLELVLYLVSGDYWNSENSSFNDLYICTESGKQSKMRMQIRFDNETVTVDNAEQYFGDRRIYYIPEGSSLEDYSIASEDGTLMVSLASL